MADIKEQLKKLIALQKNDKELHDLKETLVEKPKLIDELKAAFEVKKAKLAQLEEKSKRIQLTRKEKELELKTKEDAAAKANGQLSLLKTNKEYHAKQSEIENIKADMSLIEEKILISYDESEAVNKEIDAEKKNVAESEKEFASKKKTIDDELTQMKNRLAELEGQRIGLVAGVDLGLLSRYERMLAKKDGLAIVPIVGNSCGGCFMNVTTQQVNAAKMMEDLVMCVVCARILYLEEQNGV
ncbi:MAG: hypothetical protein HQL26_03285 [Candidatus Omnitrophica bacterium]|nr:hypothetical protein [Candidatus Omnitrophota bacterium]